MELVHGSTSAGHVPSSAIHFLGNVPVATQGMCFLHRCWGCSALAAAGEVTVWVTLSYCVILWQGSDLTWKWDQMLDASDKLIISNKLCCIYCTVRKQRSCFFLEYLHFVTKGLKWLRFIYVYIFIYLIRHWVAYSILSHLSTEFFIKRHPVRCSRQSYEQHWYC